MRFIISRASFVLTFSLIFFLSKQSVFGQQSVARRWNEAIIEAIKRDFARPPIHARNLFHLSAAMYDAWAAYDTSDISSTYILGNKLNGIDYPFTGTIAPSNIREAREKAISYASYRILYSRFRSSPNYLTTRYMLDTLMANLGYSTNISDVDYTKGPAELGNYIAQCVLAHGLNDGSNENLNYSSQFYQPINPPMFMAYSGNQAMAFPNRWQPLQLTVAIDQNGNPIPSTQIAQSPEWGNVFPFSLEPADSTHYVRDGNTYPVYLDPGPFPTLNIGVRNDSTSEFFKWNMQMVLLWSSHMDPADSVKWDISPKGISSNDSIPSTIGEYHNYYKDIEGGTKSISRTMNPSTGQPYESQVVLRADYARVLSQFWADGPRSETPPGHWFRIMNDAMDKLPIKKFNGVGPILDELEWDVKAYFTLGGGLHDAAITAWGIKGWYDGVRPVSALRYMADLGQSSDSLDLHYHPGGLTLIPGFIELVRNGDLLAGSVNQNVGKIKVKTWVGPNQISNPIDQIGGVRWILAENWWPYQASTFVTPPFPGYISGHSTYSRTAAEILTFLTGDEYFPGGMGEYIIKPSDQFLKIEKGPTKEIRLQWATYRDASDQTSLSRIWGGIHPPIDDIPGRRIGILLGKKAFLHAKRYFFKDRDGDGVLNDSDCNDFDPSIYPHAVEVCDGKDNDCNGLVDDGLFLFTYFKDNDHDGFGNNVQRLDTCLAFPLLGYVTRKGDCNDNDSLVHPLRSEECDAIDNNCDGTINEGLVRYIYYFDKDLDGFGDQAINLDTCISVPPIGFVTNSMDCDDQNQSIRPGAMELCDGIDNNCNGQVDEGLTFYSYYRDFDNDGFGNVNIRMDTCLNIPPVGFVSNSMDCDDSKSEIRPGVTEVCDGVDNDCNGLIDDGLIKRKYYFDSDRDGYGNILQSLDTCLNLPPIGYVILQGDCNDQNPNIHPNQIDICDLIDNDCNGIVDQGFIKDSLFLDFDQDGFGTRDSIIYTCVALQGFVKNGLDCNDHDPKINPINIELIDGVDNNCNGQLDEYRYASLFAYPNPANEILKVEYSPTDKIQITIISMDGKVWKMIDLQLENQTAKIDLSDLPMGVYCMHWNEQLNFSVSGKQLLIKL